VLDLEDGVRPDAKDEAREHVRRWRAGGGTGVVRINSASSRWHQRDLETLSDRACAVMLPKAADADEIDEVLTHLPTGSCVIPIVESAAAVLDARSLAATHGVVRLAFGNGDLAAELGVDLADQFALAHARGAVVLASAAAGIAPPLDGVTIDLTDQRVVFEDARHAVSLGFTGKLCIHPQQVAAVHAAFAPSGEEVGWAQRIVDAAGDGGVAAVDGEMVDKPVLERARRVLLRAQSGRADDAVMFSTSGTDNVSR
jgi:citrate lyase subunit beta/citryl-CoA lyase